MDTADNTLIAIKVATQTIRQQIAALRDNVPNMRDGDDYDVHYLAWLDAVQALEIAFQAVGAASFRYRRPPLTPRGSQQSNQKEGQ